MSTKFSAKIIDSDDSESNEKNQSWWQNNPMTYDWGHDLGEVRYNKDYLSALSRMDKYSNIEIVSCEMVIFEWLRKSRTEEFKTISQLIK